VKRIAAHSGGLPRLINGACDRALLLAYTMETHEITPAMASLAIADLAKEEKPQQKRRLMPLIALLFLAALLAAGVTLRERKKATPPPAPAPSPATDPGTGDDRNAVRLLQELLAKNGFYSGKPDGNFDARTEEGVRRFQEAEQLQVDGRPGGQTLLRLYKKAGGVFPAMTSAKPVSKESR
jgi:general secretion pathway protein A